MPIGPNLYGNARTALPVAGLLLLMLVMGYHGGASNSDQELRQAVEQFITYDYSEDAYQQLQEHIRQGTQLERLEVLQQEALALSRVRVISAEFQGLPSDEAVLKAEIAVAAATPPDGRRYRYFRVKHSWLTGWLVLGETSAKSF